MLRATRALAAAPRVLWVRAPMAARLSTSVQAPIAVMPPAPGQPPQEQAAPSASDPATAPPPKSKVDWTDYLGAGALVGTLGLLVWYLMRQKKISETKRALCDELDKDSIICPGEIKELREVNNVE